MSESGAEAEVGAGETPPGDDEHPLRLPGSGPAELARMMAAAARTGSPQMAHAAHELGPDSLAAELVELAQAVVGGAATSGDGDSGARAHRADEVYRELCESHGVDPAAAPRHRRAA